LSITNRFDSRSNDLKRQPVSGIPLALQRKLDKQHLKLKGKKKEREKQKRKEKKKEKEKEGEGDDSEDSGDSNDIQPDENFSSHLKLINYKETKKKS